MIYMNYSDKIRVPANTAPQCRCSECILNPESSHGMYAIGAYQFPTLLSKRGNRSNPQSVTYRWISPSGSERGMSTAPFAPSEDERVWAI